MTRLHEIQEKLQYVEHKRQDLMSDFLSSKKNEREPEFLKHTVADILSSSVECYDYCAKDILENKILPNTINTGLRDRIHDGKVRAYFPFYRNQLTNEGQHFREVSTIEPLLYKYLLNLADNIQANNQIPNTSFYYGDVIRLKKLVNDKKHDCLIAIESNNEQEILVENPNFNMVIPIKNQKGLGTFQVPANSEISRVTEFRLEHIDEEVGKFCLFAWKSTNIILQEIYEQFF
ncbi:hypothetical protein [Calothrix rhizosoleniae]|uniref:hypothetical protein n=1 Tax=Calothrix rhizosoleniae TaxID=888997 RepID=UPI000B4A0741|nr:hypothetical protein [Calothrix rhizosoleniae]